MKGLFNFGGLKGNKGGNNGGNNGGYGAPPPRPSYGAPSNNNNGGGYNAPTVNQNFAAPSQGYNSGGNGGNQQVGLPNLYPKEYLTYFGQEFSDIPIKIS